MYILDTNIIIKLRKRNKDIFQNTEKDLYTSILSVIEYPKAVLCENLNVIQPSATIFESALDISVSLRKNGTPIPSIDIIIGATALENSLCIVSEDNHFQSLVKVRPQLRLITLEEFMAEI